VKLDALAELPLATFQGLFAREPYRRPARRDGRRAAQLGEAAQLAWFWVMTGAASITGSAMGAALLSGGFARRIALSAALGSGAIGSLLVVHGETWSVFAAAVVVGRRGVPSCRC
jgi:hypothetical protein